MRTVKSAFAAASKIVFAAVFAASAYVAPSKEPPGGLAPENCPMFVSIGFDDNGYPDAMEWFRTFVNNKSNPAGSGNSATGDGSPVRVSFYVNAKYGDVALNSNGEAVIDAWKALYNDGHEIGNHTYKHEYMAGMDSAAQLPEITNCTDFLVNKVGIAEDDITGFRAPYLNYNNATMSNVNKGGLKYDCSIEHSLEGSGTDFYWPYMLDNGSVSPIVSVNVGAFPGMWEVPMNEVIIPQEHTNGQWHGLTGLDYNMWVGRKMNKEAFLATLKYTLDQRLAGNRAPFTYGAHSDYYSQDKVWDSWAAPDATLAEMREAFEEFIDYALTKPDVRIVPVQTILDWMENPVGLDGAVGVSSKQKAVQKQVMGYHFSSNGLTLQVPESGVLSVEIFSLSGRLLGRVNGLTAGSNGAVVISDNLLPSAEGVFVVKVSGSINSFVQKVVR